MQGGSLLRQGGVNHVFLLLMRDKWIWLVASPRGIFDTDVRIIHII